MSVLGTTLATGGAALKLTGDQILEDITEFIQNNNSPQVSFTRSQINKWAKTYYGEVLDLNAFWAHINASIHHSQRLKITQDGGISLKSVRIQSTKIPIRERAIKWLNDNNANILTSINNTDVLLLNNLFNAKFPYNSYKTELQSILINNAHIIPFESLSEETDTSVVLILKDLATVNRLSLSILLKALLGHTRTRNQAVGLLLDLAPSLNDLEQAAEALILDGLWSINPSDISIKRHSERISLSLSLFSAIVDHANLSVVRSPEGLATLKRLFTIIIKCANGHVRLEHSASGRTLTLLAAAEINLLKCYVYLTESCMRELVDAQEQNEFFGAEIINWLSRLASKYNQYADMEQLLGLLSNRSLLTQIICSASKNRNTLSSLIIILSRIYKEHPLLLTQALIDTIQTEDLNHINNLFDIIIFNNNTFLTSLSVETIAQSAFNHSDSYTRQRSLSKIFEYYRLFVRNSITLADVSNAQCLSDIIIDARYHHHNADLRGEIEKHAKNVEILERQHQEKYRDYSSRLEELQKEINEFKSRENMRKLSLLRPSMNLVFNIIDELDRMILTGLEKEIEIILDSIRTSILRKLLSVSIRSFGEPGSILVEDLDESRFEVLTGSTSVTHMKWITRGFEIDENSEKVILRRAIVGE